ncbi:hypothetical protein H696_02191 [Fonticula alba]|uniref:Rho-GAP domain-containing protein n=1 Tax=Fonticula alba TaxID=691883 RepID=A0A058ZBD3_FONAL|nr:hypothetical protein H696_02191 [Fonticula alba]KCV71241.1 hypothetical protein H696_02191 [Fonticula alba]|eukprot:XP_009494364.1 hypothetical protein H696_02191 [Fonticula alba]
MAVRLPALFPRLRSSLHYAHWPAGDRIDLKEICPSPHDVTSLLKLYLRELPEPLFTFELYDCFMAANEISDVPTRLDCLRKIITYLPPGNYTLILFLIKFLRIVALLEDSNKMGPNNLSAVFAPNLLRSESEQDPSGDMSGFDIKGTQHASEIMYSLLVDFDHIFPDGGSVHFDFEYIAGGVEPPPSIQVDPVVDVGLAATEDLTAVVDPWMIERAEADGLADFGALSLQAGDPAGAAGSGYTTDYVPSPSESVLSDQSHCSVATVATTTGGSGGGGGGGSLTDTESPDGFASGPGPAGSSSAGGPAPNGPSSFSRLKHRANNIKQQLSRSMKGNMQHPSQQQQQQHHHGGSGGALAGHHSAPHISSPLTTGALAPEYGTEGDNDEGDEDDALLCQQQSQQPLALDGHTAAISPCDYSLADRWSAASPAGGGGDPQPAASALAGANSTAASPPPPSRPTGASSPAKSFSISAPSPTRTFGGPGSGASPSPHHHHSPPSAGTLPSKQRVPRPATMAGAPDPGAGPYPGRPAGLGAGPQVSDTYPGRRGAQHPSSGVDFTGSGRAPSHFRHSFAPGGGAAATAGTSPAGSLPSSTTGTSAATPFSYSLQSGPVVSTLAIDPVTFLNSGSTDSIDRISSIPAATLDSSATSAYLAVVPQAGDLTLGMGGIGGAGAGSGTGRGRDGSPDPGSFSPALLNINTGALRRSAGGLPGMDPGAGGVSAPPARRRPSQIIRLSGELFADASSSPPPSSTSFARLAPTPPSASYDVWCQTAAAADARRRHGQQPGQVASRAGSPDLAAAVSAAASAASTAPASATSSAVGSPSLGSGGAAGGAEFGEGLPDAGDSDVSLRPVAPSNGPHVRPMSLFDPPVVEARPADIRQLANEINALSGRVPGSGATSPVATAAAAAAAGGESASSSSSSFALPPRSARGSTFAAPPVSGARGPAFATSSPFATAAEESTPAFGAAPPPPGSHRHSKPNLHISTSWDTGARPGAGRPDHDPAHLPLESPAIIQEPNTRPSVFLKSFSSFNPAPPPPVAPAAVKPRRQTRSSVVLQARAFEDIAARNQMPAHGPPAPPPAALTGRHPPAAAPGSTGGHRL